MDDYSYVVNDAPDHLHHDRKVLLDRGHDPDQPRPIIPCNGPSQAHFTYRASAYFPGEADEAGFFELAEPASRAYRP